MHPDKCAIPDGGVGSADGMSPEGGTSSGLGAMPGVKCIYIGKVARLKKMLFRDVMHTTVSLSINYYALGNKSTLLISNTILRRKVGISD